MKNTKSKLTRQQLIEMDPVNTVFHNGILPGTWDTLEVETDVETNSTSYNMFTKLHPNSPTYIDFWGNVDPYGPGCTNIIIRLIEFSALAEHSHRWSVTTSRFTTRNMTTNKFHTLEEAIEFMVGEMIRTTKHYDKINKRKTIIWDDEAIENHDIH